MTKNFRGIVAGFALVLGLLATPLFTSAQDVASLTGIVTDKSGGVVSGASLKLTDTRTDAAYATKSASDGSYKFAKLARAPATYSSSAKTVFKAIPSRTFICRSQPLRRRTYSSSLGRSTKLSKSNRKVPSL